MQYEGDEKSMKRNAKNIIMIVGLIAVLVAAGFTMHYAKENIQYDDPFGPNMQGQQPPEKPGGQSGDDQSQQPPEMPGGQSGDDQSQQPPEMPGMGGAFNRQLTAAYYVVFAVESLIAAFLIIYLIMSAFNKKTFKETFSSSKKIALFILLVIVLTGGITLADKIFTEKVVLSSSNSGFQGNGQMPVGQSAAVAYSAKTEISEDCNVSQGDYQSSTADENAIMTTGDIDANLSGITVSKSGDSDGGDSTSFYGTNSAILAKDGSRLTITGATITTDATGANGVFSYGGSATTNNSKSDGTTITISDSKITTTKDNSGGIMTTGGGNMVAENLEINTAGTSSAAIRSDRGGGNVSVTGGTYKTTGKGSPAIYSTANITVDDATLLSEASEGIIIEGKNSVAISNTKLIDTNSVLNGMSTTYKNIFIYQSMSGDAAGGNAAFTANDSSITTNKGDSFYITNTSATINLSNNSIVNNDSEGAFLRAQKDSWGNSGSNGGDVVLNMENQKAAGDIVIDSISTLKLSMKASSDFQGTINGDNTAKTLTLKLDASSKIKLTGDSYVSSLEDEDATYSNIDFNGFKLYVNGKAIN